MIVTRQPRVSISLTLTLARAHDRDRNRTGIRSGARLRARARNPRRFHLAQDADRLLLSLRFMRFSFGSCASLLLAAALIIICSCEKHHVGEMPEVQKEHVDPTKEWEEMELQSGQIRIPSSAPLSQ